MSLLVPLAASSPQHGGKAEGLRRLEAAGLPVPPGVAVDARIVRYLLDGQPAATAELRTWLEGAGPLVAVRSSALVEDGGTRSFAGMFETRTNVEADLEAVLTAVRIVSASGTAARVQEYGGASDELIPVVIQVMVDAPTASGVTFTSATQTDGRHGAYTEWVEGYSEQLVAGRSVPKRMTVPWDTDDRLDRQKSVLSGGSLEPRSLDRLCSALEVTRRIDHGVWDLEWSIDQAGALWMLQMRPATTAVLVPPLAGRGDGVAAAPGNATGPARPVSSRRPPNSTKSGRATCWSPSSPMSTSCPPCGAPRRS